MKYKIKMTIKCRTLSMWENNIPVALYKDK